MREIKTVLITGASKGIGADTALLFAEKGYNVVINYNKSEKEAKQIQQKVENFGVRSLLVKADISNQEEVEKMVNLTISTFGKIDVLVNNAGVDEIKPFIDLELSDYNKIVDTNLKGLFLVTNAVSKSMISNRYGKIINVSSVWGLVGSSCEVLYSMTKAGIIGFTKALAKELGLSNINVNCVAPGFIETEMNKDLSQEDVQQIIDETPLNRTGTPRDVANTIYFLASDEASFITGHTLNVSGGWII